MTIHLEKELVATRYDSGVSYYTIERTGRRWTVGISDGEWEKMPKQARRDHLGRLLTKAMAGPPDGES
jgi:hypothetical protein